jgi:protein gp37
MIFVNSMSDLFQDAVPDGYVLDVVRVMAAANWHTYQVLTKRSVRMCSLLNSKLHDFAALHHIWWGVSVEDRKYGVPRIKQLQESDCAMRFLSIEPLLEPLGQIDLSGINWVIVGGESGSGARPMKREWVVEIREQCREKSVPFFFKQWGGIRKSESGRELDGHTYDEFPPIPNSRRPPVDRMLRIQRLEERAVRWREWQSTQSSTQDANKATRSTSR